MSHESCASREGAAAAVSLMYACGLVSWQQCWGASETTLGCQHQVQHIPENTSNVQTYKNFQLKPQAPQRALRAEFSCTAPNELLNNPVHTPYRQRRPPACFRTPHLVVYRSFPLLHLQAECMDDLYPLAEHLQRAAQRGAVL